MKELPRIVACLMLMAIFSRLAGQDNDSPWMVGFDAFDSMRPAEDKRVSHVTEINRIPLFENAPFLHLHHGDKLVSAEQPDKGESRHGYYVLSGGKYYEIVARNEAGNLLLEDDWQCRDPVLFDWVFTLPHAQVLAQWEKGSGQRLNLLQYADIYRAIIKRFPDKECRRPDTIEPAEDRVLSIPGQQVAEFQGIAYNATFNRLERFALRIGPATCVMNVQALIQGPPRVDRWEFDEDYIRNNNANLGGNMTSYEMPDPETAKRKRAEYGEWLAFRTIVLDVIAPNRVRSDEEKALANPPPAAAGKSPATE